ncbi:MAG: zinc-binding dehydrogenase [Anaerolineae bacterium]|nr:zinc-binding dehydrogenase [Anaerolineae bacterium]
MKAKQVWVERPGGTEVLTLREVDLPPLQPNEVCIEVEASGVTLADIIARRGKPHPGSPRIPLVLGFEIAGTIMHVGSDVSGLTVGQRVIAVVHSGGYSSHICVEAWRCIPIPDGMAMISAVALVVNYWTAWHLLHRAGNVQPRQRVLIHGVSGGVGTALAQLGHLAGLEMYGTASLSKHEQVRALNVIPIDYRHDDFVARIAEWSASNGVDLVIDPIGGNNWLRSYRTLGKGGRLLLTGIQSLADKPNVLLLPSALRMLFLALLPDGKSVRFVGLIPENLRDSYREDLTKLVIYLAEGKINPIINRTFPLSEVAEAHRYLESGEVTGKLVLTPN